MNVSRSGRVRKKSKFLTDSEFHTPKESIIYGLSSLTAKNSLTQSETKTRLEKTLEGAVKKTSSNESKL